MKHILIVCTVILSLLTGCSEDDTLFCKYRTIPLSQWHKDSVLVFTVEIADTLPLYEIDLLIRNTDEYAYQNLWLFFSQSCDNEPSERDTVNVFLADDYGNWRGTGVRSFFDNCFLYRDSVRFHRAGAYRFTIAHGMRYEMLDGISDAGLQIIVKSE
ncbi:MAG: gliding motility lipoprotein GldH [Prevotellaceae bacterium]|jgi:gliding motility-associated lipoprotein GldH|nr:gliding motility lipoprotein GldH [Prevotellaceae bacterium]